MREIKNDDQLYMINGGSISITGGLISAFSTAAKILLEIGRSIGGAIRRGKDKNLC